MRQFSLSRSKQWLTCTQFSFSRLLIGNHGRHEGNGEGERHGAHEEGHSVSAVRALAVAPALAVGLDTHVTAKSSLNVAEAKNRPVSKVITPLKDMLKQNVTVSEPCNLLHSSVRNPFPKHSDIALHCLEIGRKTSEFLCLEESTISEESKLNLITATQFIEI